MAESQPIKLVITADTSDAKKKIEDVGKTKVDPVKVDVVADKVKVDSPTVAPVKVPVVADKVKVDAPKVEPITIKSRFDGSAIGQATKALHGVRELAGKVMSAFGLFGLAVNGVMAIVSGVKMLHEWMNREQKQAKELQDTLSRHNIADSIARQASNYEKLNKAIAETVRLEKERSDIQNARRLAERTIEDANAERNKQNEISKLDPSSANYAAQKAEIERKYQLQATERTRSRAGEDARQTASDLYGQARSKDKEALSLEQEYKRAKRTEDVALERNWKAGMEARGGDEEAKKRKEETEKQWQAAHDAKKKIKEAMEAARREAQSLRNRAGEAAGSNVAANIKADADKTRIENDRKEELQKDIAETDRKLKEGQKERKRRESTVEDVTLERQKTEDIAALNPADKDYESQKREIERTYETKAAENKVARAENDYEKKAAEEELATVQMRHGIERRQENAAKIPELESYAARAASVDEVSQNRLTAMGLGSGVSASGSIQSDVSKLVELLKQNVEATKANKPVESSSTAVYGE